jgi:hypothetical protein
MNIAKKSAIGNINGSPSLGGGEVASSEWKKGKPRELTKMYDLERLIHDNDIIPVIYFQNFI